jgi:hypothetical protein
MATSRSACNDASVLRPRVRSLTSASSPRGARCRAVEWNSRSRGRITCGGCPGVCEPRRRPYTPTSENPINAKFVEFGFSRLGRSFFDGAPPAETRADRSDGQCQRISLRQPLHPATTCSTPMPRMRLWDRVYCCPTADKAPDMNIGGFSFLRDLQEKQRADERTRTADLLITSLLL